MSRDDQPGAYPPYRSPSGPPSEGYGGEYGGGYGGGPFPGSHHGDGHGRRYVDDRGGADRDAPGHRSEPYRRSRAGDPRPGEPRHGRAAHGAPPPRRRTGWTVALVVVLVLVLGAGGVLLAHRRLNPQPQAGVGDCVQVMSPTGGDIDLRPLTCSSPKAVFKVAKRLEAAAAHCPHGDYAQFTQAAGGAGLRLCLMLNAHRGDCFDHLGQASQATHVSCAGAETKVVKVVTGQATPKACHHTKADHVLMYADPATTICTRKP